jgi:hypothetical protein
MIGILLLLSFVGRGGAALIPLLVMAAIVYTLVRQLPRVTGPTWSGTGTDQRVRRPETATESPVIDIPVTRVAEPPPTYSLPVSGPTLDLRLSFEASDLASVARLVPDFVRDQVTIIESGKRLLRAGWCEYSYRLRGPESVLRELCTSLDQPGYLNLTAFW